MRVPQSQEEQESGAEYCLHQGRGKASIGSENVAADMDSGMIGAADISSDLPVG